MKGFIGKIILFAIISIFLYRNRHHMFRLFLGIEVLRRLGTSMSFKWMDVKDWMRHKISANEMDQA